MRAYFHLVYALPPFGLPDFADYFVDFWLLLGRLLWGISWRRRQPEALSLCSGRQHYMIVFRPLCLITFRIRSFLAISRIVTIHVLEFHWLESMSRGYYFGISGLAASAYFAQPNCLLRPAARARNIACSPLLSSSLLLLLISLHLMPDALRYHDYIYLKRI